MKYWRGLFGDDPRSKLEVRGYRDASVSTRATWQAAVQAERDTRAKTRDVDNGLRRALQVAFDGSADALAL